MITWRIRGQVYQACSEWKDLTLEKFIKLSQIDVPKKLERLLSASAQLSVDGKKEKKAALIEYEAATDSITQRDLVKVFPVFYGKVIQLLTDIPAKVVDLCHGDVRTEMFDGTLRPFILSLIYSQPVTANPDNNGVEMYTPPEIEKFDLDGTWYHFPKSLKLYDDIIPMADEKMISFTEAADIDLAIRELRNDGVIRFPTFMGIYCRKEGEEYNEKVALERAELFKKVDMSIVWALFFCIDRLTATLQSYIQVFLKSRLQEMRALTQEKVA